MRSSSFVIGVVAGAASLLLAGCGTKKSEDKGGGPPPGNKGPSNVKPGSSAGSAVKREPDKKPLPGLLADPGGSTGKVAWAASVGGLGTDSTRDLAIAPSGDVYAAGYFDGEATFGAAGKRTAPGTKKTDGFLVKLDGTGKAAWVRTFGAEGDDVANGVAFKNDRVVVVGNFTGKLKAGELEKTGAGSDDLYAAAFDKDGKEVFLFTGGGTESDGANAIAATPDGGWVIGGSFTGEAMFGTATLKSKGKRGKTDAVLLKLAATGDLEWVKQFGGDFDDMVQKLAVDAQGSIFVQGQFRDKANWGGDELVAGGGADFDIVLAKYDLNGDHLWSKRFGNALDDVAGGITVDPSGAVTMSGAFDKAISFGPGDDHNSLGESDVFVARFSGDGKLEWAKTFGAERPDIAADIGSDGSGNVIVTGWFEHNVDFGTGVVSAKNNNKDAFVLKLDPTGKSVWTQVWGDKDHDQGRAVAVDEKGNAAVAGIYRFTFSHGPTPLESVRAEGDRIPTSDTFIVRIDR